MFTKRSTAEDVTAGLDLTGKTIVITGINSGIGYEAMRVLALRGAHIIALARTREKASAACSTVTGKTTPMACELSDLDSVSACADEIKAEINGIDALICNAGIMALPKLNVKDGLELQFLTNHMGHFLLAYLLQDQLKKSQGRIVMLSSEGHRMPVKGGIDFSNLDGNQGYNPWKFYGQSKLANLLTARAFDQRLKADGVRANAVHPGVINTNLARDVGGAIGFLLDLKPAQYLLENVFGKSIAQGASTECYVAVHPDTQGKGGLYFSDNAEAKTSHYGQSMDLADRLWRYSTDYLKTYIG